MPAGKMYRAPGGPIIARKQRKRPVGVSKNVEKYVKTQVNKSEWSNQQIAVLDFDISGITSNLRFLLTRPIVGQLLENSAEIFSQGKVETDSEGNKTYNLKVKIDYIKWQLRYALGEDEVASAVSQNVRQIICRTEDQYEDVQDASNIVSIVGDHDGSLRYHTLYGGTKGLVSDKFYYLMSQNAHGTTTAGGQSISKGFKTLGYVDTYSVDAANLDDDVTQSEHGQLTMQVFCDNPSGENADLFGYVELGWRYLKG